MKRSELKVARPTREATLTDDQGGVLHVTYYEDGITPAEFEKLQEMAAAVARAESGEQTKDFKVDLGIFADLLVNVLADWDFEEEDGTKTPINPQTLSQFKITEQMWLLSGLMQDNAVPE